MGAVDVAEEIHRELTEQLLLEMEQPAVLVIMLVSGTIGKGDLWPTLICDAITRLLAAPAQCSMKFRIITTTLTFSNCTSSYFLRWTAAHEVVLQYIGIRNVGTAESVSRQRDF